MISVVAGTASITEHTFPQKIILEIVIWAISNTRSRSCVDIVEGGGGIRANLNTKSFMRVGIVGANKNTSF